MPANEVAWKEQSQQQRQRQWPHPHLDILLCEALLHGVCHILPDPLQERLQKHKQAVVNGYISNLRCP